MFLDVNCTRKPESPAVSRKAGACTIWTRTREVTVNRHPWSSEVRDLHDPTGRLLIDAFDQIEISGDQRWGFVTEYAEEPAYWLLHIVDLEKGAIMRTIHERCFPEDGIWDLSRQRYVFEVTESVGPLTKRVEMLDCTKPGVEHRTLFRVPGCEPKLRPDPWSPDGKAIAFAVTADLKVLSHRLVQVELSDPPIVHDVESLSDQRVQFEWRVEWINGRPSTRVAGPGD